MFSVARAVPSNKNFFRERQEAMYKGSKGQCRRVFDSYSTVGGRGGLLRSTQWGQCRRAGLESR